MAKLTEKENWLKVINGETPDWVPRYGMGRDPFAKTPSAATTLGVSWLNMGRTPDGGVDLWGVPYITTEETGGMALPKPNEFILDDIRNWRNVIKAPDSSEIDWESLAKKDVENNEKNMGAPVSSFAIMQNTFVGFFQSLMNFMGFNNGLVAMFEEPDEVHALFEYLCDFYVSIAEKQLQYYPRADVYCITDDTATATNPFISPTMYREMVKPYATRLAKVGTDVGMTVMMHNCGRCEESIDDWMDFNTHSWNPAQIVNDLDGIKEKYGNKMVIIGGWDSQGPVGWPTCDEELMRSEVKKTIDRFAAGGGFMFWGSIYGPVGDEYTNNKRRWMTEAYEEYREVPYK